MGRLLRLVHKATQAHKGLQGHKDRLGQMGPLVQPEQRAQPARKGLRAQPAQLGPQGRLGQPAQLGPLGITAGPRCSRLFQIAPAVFCKFLTGRVAQVQSRPQGFMSARLALRRQ